MSKNTIKYAVFKDKELIRVDDNYDPSLPIEYMTYMVNADILKEGTKIKDYTWTLSEEGKILPVFIPKPKGFFQRIIDFFKGN